MKRKKTKQHLVQTPTAAEPIDKKIPFIEHMLELRQRLFYVVASVVAFSILGYFIQQQLVHFLLRPAHGQQFIYTTPGGGLNFLFSICLYFGFALSIPLLIYQLLRYIEPLIKQRTKRLVLRYAVFSGLLAVAGGLFGYLVGLPVALRFLAHQFTTTQIQPLLTISDYMSFVTIYLLGSAMLFQLPLIISFVNRIRPLPPRKLLSFERYMVLMAFIVAAILTPTPDIVNQLFFAAPIIVVYQVAIVMVWMQNRNRKSNQQMIQLLEHDSIVQRRRIAASKQALAYNPPGMRPNHPRMAWSTTLTSGPKMVQPAKISNQLPKPRPSRLIFDIKPLSPQAR